jgi:hypothetical protein
MQLVIALCAWWYRTGGEDDEQEDDDGGCGEILPFHIFVLVRTSKLI